MASKFRRSDEHVEKPNRNVFDLSYGNQLSTHFGKLTPVFCKEVYPGDSFKIDPKFALRYLPQVFPVQTRQRVSVKYYYVRNRPLWREWMDFIGKTKSDLTTPYLDFSQGHQEFLRPSSLADYLGIPVRVKWNRTKQNQPSLLNIGAATPMAYDGNKFVYKIGGELITNGRSVAATKVGYSLSHNFYLPTSSAGDSLYNSAFVLRDVYGGIYPYDTPLGKPHLLEVTKDAIPSNWLPRIGAQFGKFITPIVPQGNFNVTCVEGTFASPCAALIVQTAAGDEVLIPLTSTDTQIKVKNLNYRRASSYSSGSVSFDSIVSDIKYIIGYVNFTKNAIISTTLKINQAADTPVYWGDVALYQLPYYNSKNTSGLRISALKFRAFKSIYNALIRNAENNPLIINGVPEYNKYVESDDGGPEPISHFSLDYANWAEDRFTTALPSPQQGNAPLVGLTGVAGATLNLSSEDGTLSTIHLQVDSDTGRVIMVDGVASDVSASVSDAVMSAVDYGITINDLRNVNAYQKWLENNIKRGYKYKDQLLSHYGVKARYDVLDMPEFIGGVSRDVNVSQITQTVENEYGNLGDYGGQSYVFGDGHSIENYCDEHGFIVGIMSIYPMPLYEDVLPKDLLKSSPLDYYFAEFGKIGMQPITKKELAFSQSYLAGEQDEVFGYQRAWYDLLESLDEMHGLYHSDFRNFLLGREFSDAPELGRDFLTISDQDLNNTFYVDDGKDKILGEIYHKLTVKRPIPLYGQAAIE